MLLFSGLLPRQWCFLSTRAGAQGECACCSASALQADTSVTADVGGVGESGCGPVVAAQR